MMTRPDLWQKKKLREQCKTCSKKNLTGEWCKEFFTCDSAFSYLQGHDCGYQKTDILQEERG